MRLTIVVHRFSLEILKLTVNFLYWKNLAIQLLHHFQNCRIG